MIGEPVVAKYALTLAACQCVREETTPSDALPFRSVIAVWVIGVPVGVGESTKATVRCERPTPPLCSEALMPVLVPRIDDGPPLNARFVGRLPIAKAEESDEPA